VERAIVGMSHNCVNGDLPQDNPEVFPACDSFQRCQGGGRKWQRQQCRCQNASDSRYAWIKNNTAGQGVLQDHLRPDSVMSPSRS
jgi:hypothetical protein